MASAMPGLVAASGTVPGLIDDFDRLYQAAESRDPRFDGRFIIAVTSTGIYCRPTCPARMPHRHHIRFYACPAAAEAAGFRACRRCHPEASPGSADWNGRDAIVARALRLIADGIVDVEGITGLAQRLAVGPRQVHRRLMAAVGVGPLALAHTRRAQMAHLLITQTDLPLTEIAFAAGFASIRQFNASIHQRFGQPPTGLRRQRSVTPAGGGEVVLRLACHPPFDFQFLLRYLAQRAVPGLEAVSDDQYHRAVGGGPAAGTVSIALSPTGDKVILRARLSDIRLVGPVVQQCRHLLDLDTNPAAVAEVLGRDPLLAPLVAARPGLRLPGTVDGFELAARAILGHRVAPLTARGLIGRLVLARGEPLSEPAGGVTHCFPGPARLAEADLSRLDLPAKRVTALRLLARAVADGTIRLDRGVAWEETADRLRALPGVGAATAAYIALRALGDPDAFPATDRRLRRASARLGLATEPAALLARAEGWRPWRAYAAMHLWMADG